MFVGMHGDINGCYQHLEGRLSHHGRSNGMGIHLPMVSACLTVPTMSYTKNMDLPGNAKCYNLCGKNWNLEISAKDMLDTGHPTHGSSFTTISCSWGASDLGVYGEHDPKAVLQFTICP